MVFEILGLRVKGSGLEIAFCRFVLFNNLDTVLSHITQE